MFVLVCLRGTERASEGQIFAITYKHSSLYFLCFNLEENIVVSLSRLVHLLMKCLYIWDMCTFI